MFSTDFDLFICLFFLQLALKHRQGKNHKTRIVVFIGSPIIDDEKEVLFSCSIGCHSVTY